MRKQITIFHLAQQARALELSMSLKNVDLWRLQITVVILGLARLISLGSLIAIALALVLAQMPGEFILINLAWSALTVVFYNPHRFFWRNIFVERANAAYNAVLHSPDIQEWLQ